MIEGTVKYEGVGDVMFAFYQDGAIVSTMPTKDSDYELDISKTNCTNGASITWNNENWEPTVKNLTTNKTKCNLYFKIKNSKLICDESSISTSCTIAKKADIDTNDLVYDGTNDDNLRYIGANPNNYVKFNDELWRIIGVFNNIDDGTGKKEWRTKIIRNEDLGWYSWDSSESSINEGCGINEWSQADLMTLLNTSLYWNRTSGTCYNGKNNVTVACDFRKIGLTVTSKSMITNVIWNTGAIVDDSKFDDLVGSYYQGEHSNNTGKMCSPCPYCTDTVERTTTWTGKIGLMYPSDYGYATGGDSRNNCLNIALDTWYFNKICIENDWLFNNGNSGYQWTLTPLYTYGYGSRLVKIDSGGSVLSRAAAEDATVRPTLYLSSNVQISGGSGTSTDPYQLTI